MAPQGCQVNHFPLQVPLQTPDSAQWFWHAGFYSEGRLPWYSVQSGRCNSWDPNQDGLLAAGGPPASSGRSSGPRFSVDVRSLSANPRGSTRRPTGGPPGSRRMSGAHLGNFKGHIIFD
jgi:hypothetical protein